MTKAEMQAKVASLGAENAALREVIIAIKTIAGFSIERAPYNSEHYQHNNQVYFNRQSTILAMLFGYLDSFCEMSHVTAEVIEVHAADLHNWPARIAAEQPFRVAADAIPGSDESDYLDGDQCSTTDTTSRNIA